MKISKRTTIEIGKIILCLGFIPLLFVKLFHEVGYLVSADGGSPLRVNYYYSIADNLSEISVSVVIPIVVLCVCAILSAIGLLWKNKITRTASRIAFAVSVLMMIAGFITEAFTYRCY